MMTSKHLLRALMLTGRGLLLAGAAWADDSRGSDLRRLSAEFRNGREIDDFGSRLKHHGEKGRCGSWHFADTADPYRKVTGSTRGGSVSTTSAGPPLNTAHRAKIAPRHY